ncbi:hypothetical protein PF006_g33290, partial [Phytophthora fragariae]
RLASFIKTSAHYEDYDGEDGEDGRLQGNRNGVRGFLSCILKCVFLKAMTDLQGCPDFMKIRVLMSALG